jgi:hypothetical protein
VDATDVEERNRIYAAFVATGRPPTDVDEAVLRRLHEAHALVLEQNTLAIRMLNPFSCVPSAWRVEAAGRTWYANCAWDAFGVCAALHADGHISASCADCGEPLEIDVQDARPQPDDLLFHVLVPAAHWWDDIVFT